MSEVSFDAHLPTHPEWDCWDRRCEGAQPPGAARCFSKVVLALGSPTGVRSEGPTGSFRPSGPQDIPLPAHISLDNYSKASPKKCTRREAPWKGNISTELL